ncbi:MAG: hypothetical protein JW934_12540 [Anaerolineae bacterium]|nr:hypothetical protein [Anaerolineae bacterium]
MIKRVLRYTLYLLVLVIALVLIRQNWWKAQDYWYYFSAPLIRHVLVDPLSADHTTEWEYYLHIPRGYTADRVWPVFVYVHGTDGSGRDALFIWRPLADQERFFLLTPTFPDWTFTHLQGGEDKILWAMIDQVAETYNVERTRIFIAGFSGGAQFAHRFAFKYPKNVSGVSALSAGSYDPPPNHARSVPFAVSVGQNDTERTEPALWFARELKKNGNPVWYKTFPDVGHQICDDAVDLTLELFRQTAKKGNGL